MEGNVTVGAGSLGGAGTTGVGTTGGGEACAVFATTTGGVATTGGGVAVADGVRSGVGKTIATVGSGDAVTVLAAGAAGFASGLDSCLTMTGGFSFGTARVSAGLGVR